MEGYSGKASFAQPSQRGTHRSSGPTVQTSSATCGFARPEESSACLCSPWARIGARSDPMVQSGPDRAGPDGARRVTWRKRAPTIAQRRFSLVCGRTIVSSKTRARRRNRGPIGPRRCNRAPTCPTGPANRFCGTLGGAQRETLLEPFLKAAP